MWGLYAQAGMGTNVVLAPLLVAGLMVGGVVIALWVTTLALSGGRGPHLPRVGRLPRLVVRLLAAVAVVLWAVCGCAYAVGGSRSEVFNATLPSAVALTLAALNVRNNGRAGPDGGVK